MRFECLGLIYICIKRSLKSVEIRCFCIKKVGIGWSFCIKSRFQKSVLPVSELGNSLLDYIKVWNFFFIGSLGEENRTKACRVSDD